MPAIGRRSTKPLNDPPRRTVVPRPLYFNLGNPPGALPSPRFSARAPIPDAKLPHFSVLTAGRWCRRSGAYGNAIASRVSDVSYTPTGMICRRCAVSRSDFGGIFMGYRRRDATIYKLPRCVKSALRGQCLLLIFRFFYFSIFLINFYLTLM